MIDLRDPLIQRMVDDGYDVSYHEHLKAGRVIASFMACRKNPRATYTGRCKMGNPENALADLCRRMGIEVN